MGLETSAIIAYASLAASLAGAGISAYSSHKQAKAEEEMGVYNAKVAADAQRNEELAARENATRQREENRRRLGMLQASMAKNGVNTAGGSGLDVLATASSELELQVMDLFRDSDAKQRQYGAQGAMSLWGGSQAGAAGQLSTIGTLLSGVSNTGSMYGGYRSSGVLRTAAA